MNDPRDILIKDYSYSLPEEKIAFHPLKERDASQLLIYKEGLITEDIYRNIADHIPGNSLLIFNDTKVVEARLLFRKPTGGVIEIFCLEPHKKYPDISTAMLQKGKVEWNCLVGGASKWKPGQVLEKKIKKDDIEIILKAKYIEKNLDSFTIGLSWSPAGLSFAELLHHAGAVPLPPYIKREPEPGDEKRYQTIYARYDGSVAAPTAGLHFTDHVFQQLQKKKVQIDFVTLHVGAGTFKPVKAERMEDHTMHAEFMQVSAATIKNIYNNLDNPIIAVGTTSLRTIESLYWMGRLIKFYPGVELNLSQWTPYIKDEMNTWPLSTAESLESLMDWMGKNDLPGITASTQIIMAPGYRPKIVDALITNFHQPNSTLLLLVAACIGEDWRKVYDYALNNHFRFLSYGDGSLLWLNK
jgi:S-adenosylmethionine:tRNA ribosyltransferase-isomerase